jgi:alanine dehydrogenase
MSKPEFLSFSSSELMPQEEVLEVQKSSKKLQIGIPHETCLQEKRIALTPDAVQLLVEHGHDVIIEITPKLGPKLCTLPKRFLRQI